MAEPLTPEEQIATIKAGLAKGLVLDRFVGSVPVFHPDYAPVPTDVPGLRDWIAASQNDWPDHYTADMAKAWIAAHDRIEGRLAPSPDAPRLTPDPDWERLYVDEAERYVRLSNDHAKCPRLDREARDYGLATIVRQYLRLDDALPDEKPDDMPVGIWDARVREVDNARRGVDAFLAQYAASQPVPTEPEEADRGE